MATIISNTQDIIEFRNIQTADTAFVSVQLGEWEFNTRVETGIVIDSSGPDEAPVVLSANNARKLAKWLNRAADQLDAAGGAKPAKKRPRYEQDDDSDYTA